MLGAGIDVMLGIQVFGIFCMEVCRFLARGLSDKRCSTGCRAYGVWLSELIVRIHSYGSMVLG